MIDSMTLLGLASIAAPILHRLIEALVQCVALRTRVELTQAAGDLPHGVGVSDRGADGVVWQVRTSPASGVPR